MSLPGYDAWKLATPPEYEWEDDDGEGEERARAGHEQEMHDQGAIDCDERAPWPEAEELERLYGADHRRRGGEG